MYLLIVQSVHIGTKLKVKGSHIIIKVVEGTGGILQYRFVK